MDQHATCDDVMISILPLAHMFQRIGEVSSLILSVCILLISYLFSICSLRQTVQCVLRRRQSGLLLGNSHESCGGNQADQTFDHVGGSANHEQNTRFHQGKDVSTVLSQLYTESYSQDGIRRQVERSEEASNSTEYFLGFASLQQGQRLLRRPTETGLCRLGAAQSGSTQISSLFSQLCGTLSMNDPNCNVLCEGFSFYGSSHLVHFFVILLFSLFLSRFPKATARQNALDRVRRLSWAITQPATLVHHWLAQS